MKTSFVRVFGAVALTIGAIAAIWQGQTPAPASFARMIPTGAVLTLESSDFGALLRDWQSSKERRTWLASDNYKSFSRSVLLLRLEQLRDEFAGTAGLPPDMSLVESVAGSHSVLALYNLREIEFVYITALPTAKAIETALWKKRSDYQPRQSAGVTYYVREEGGRQVAFAATDDYLLLSTRVDLMGRALSLMKAQANPASERSIESEDWFSHATAAAGVPGDIRLVADLPALIRTHQFRTYWIQDNVADLRGYSSVVSDLRREAGRMREDRTMLRDQPGPAPANIDPAMASMIPENAGLYRILASPPVDLAVSVLRQKVLAPGSSTAPDRQLDAPQVNLGNGETGSGGDFETRIDEAPLNAGASKFDERPLRSLLETAHVRAMLVAQTARPIPDASSASGVFEGLRTVVILDADSWNAEAVRNAFGSRAAIRGRYLVVGDAGNSGRATLEAGLIYAAGFAHAQERPGYLKMVRLMDQPPSWMTQGQIAPSPSDGDDEERAGAPLYFANNLASLSRTFERVTHVSITVRDTGRALQQTVTYRMAP